MTRSSTAKYPELNDTYHIYWSGRFKCNNGQCIDARFACDGQTGLNYFSLSTGLRNGSSESNSMETSANF